MAQLQRPSQNSNDAMIAEGDQESRQETDVLVQESPMKAAGTASRDYAMSPETGGEHQEGARAYHSTMSVPFQADQLGKLGEAQDAGEPVSTVFTKREVYITPGGDVTEQVTEYSTTMQPGGAGNGAVPPTTEDSDLLRSAQEQANYARQQLGLDPYFNVAAGATAFDQMNPTQAFYGTTGGVDYCGNGQLSPVLGFAVTNPDPTATGEYADHVGGAEGGSYPTKTTTE